MQEASRWLVCSKGEKSRTGFFSACPEYGVPSGGQARCNLANEFIDRERIARAAYRQMLVGTLKATSLV